MNQPQGNPRTQTELQTTFIAMLFAFVASTVCEQVADILTVMTRDWTTALSPLDIYENMRESSWLLLPPITHALLAVIMFSMSWVMWSKSAANKADIKDMFSTKYLVMLFEVLLVILYFALAKSNQVDFAAYTKGKTVASFVKSSYAKPEALQILWIFTLFAIWDYLVDVVRSPRANPPKTVPTRIGAHMLGILTYCSVSILCAALAGLVSVIAPSPSPIPAPPLQAAFADIALIMLLLLFNRAKALEYYLRMWFPEEKTRTVTARDIPLTYGGFLVIAGIILVYALSLIPVAFPCILK